jgi:hypothetical protein
LTETDLNPDIIGDFVILNETPDKIEVGIAGGRVCRFNLLDTAFDQLTPECGLLFNSHRVCKGLVSIA